MHLLFIKADIIIVEQESHRRLNDWNDWWNTSSKLQKSKLKKCQWFSTDTAKLECITNLLIWFSVLVQDHVIAGVMLTKRDTFLSRDEFMQLVYSAICPTRPGLKDHGKIQVPTPAILKPKPLWTGKQVSLSFSPTILPHKERIASNILVTYLANACFFTNWMPLETECHLYLMSVIHRGIQWKLMRSSDR